MKRREMLIKFVRTKSIPVQNDHFAACKRQQVPYVMIEPGRKYAHVSLDLIGTEHDLTDAATEEVRKYFEINWSRHNGSMMAAGATYSFITVRIEKAETVAEWLYDLAATSSNRQSCGIT